MATWLKKCVTIVLLAVLCIGFGCSTAYASQEVESPHPDIDITPLNRCVPWHITSISIDDNRNLRLTQVGNVEFYSDRREIYSHLFAAFYAGVPIALGENVNCSRGGFFTAFTLTRTDLP